MLCQGTYGGMYYLHCATDPEFSLNLLSNVSYGLGALDIVQIVHSPFSIHLAQNVFTSPKNWVQIGGIKGEKHAESIHYQ